MTNLNAVRKNEEKKAKRKVAGENKELLSLEAKYKHPLSTDEKDLRPVLDPMQHSRYEWLKTQYRYIPLRMEGLTDAQARKRTWPDLKLADQPKFDVEGISQDTATKEEQLVADKLAEIDYN
jgi:hypothetical protein